MGKDEEKSNQSFVSTMCRAKRLIIKGRCGEYLYK